MTDLNQRLAGLSPEKRKLLMQQLNKKMPVKPTVELKKRERPDRIPLSYSQQRLWILDQLEPNSSTYNVPHVMWMKGAPKIQVLEDSINEIIRRHEVLRTNVVSDEKGPFQKIHQSRKITIDIHDVTGLPHEERVFAAQQKAKEEASRAFDIAQQTLIRVLLIKLEDEQYLFLLNAHHIVVDGWSYSVLFNELCEIYQAFSEAKSSPLEDLTIQYADYTMWQNELLAEESDTLTTQVNYWLQRFEDNIPVLELPGDRPRKSVQSNQGAVLCHRITATNYQALQDLCQQHGATSFMGFSALFQILLARYSGQYDLTIGVGVANRRRQELESLVGFFVNTLAIRTDLSGEPDFLELLERVKENTLGAYSHQDLPIERLLVELELDRTLSHSPLFQVMLFFQNFPSQDIQLQNLTFSPVDQGAINAGVSRSDLALFVGEEDGGLSMYFEYATDLFDKETIESMARNLVQLLQSVLAKPIEKISKLNLLTIDQLRTLSLDWNATEQDCGDDLCIHRLFEQQVKCHPGRVAISHLGRTMSYAELNDRANYLANSLIQKGVKTGELVGLFINRSPEMLVALFAILKAGAAYVPLDPSYPSERLFFMIEDSNSRYVITEKSLNNLLNDSQVETVLVDEEQNSPALKDKLNDNSPLSHFESHSASKNTAYVIFTSGSTGRPKGVLIPHSSVVNFLKSMAKEPGMSEQDTVCAVTTLSFDIAVLELLLPLVSGAKVEIADTMTASDGAELSRLIESSKATFVQATPATWRMLLDSGWQGHHKLKLLSGGEALSRELADQLLKNCGTLWNMYGPTETTIWSSVQQVKSDEKIPTVGKPIANTKIYLVDKNLQLVPIGVPGELLIGGAGLAQGYLDRPELTAEKFITNPFSKEKNSRLYRTGDLARWTREGEVEVLGRIDHQVKLRGYRIELGEIESLLNEHESIKQSVVICREDNPGDKRLVAYFMDESSSTEESSLVSSNLDVTELRQFISQRLPDYMVPSAYVVLEQFPLTPNGKIDRLSLPKPQESSIKKADYVAPRNNEEETLAALWAELLGVERVSIHDDFFSLGGHSLLATQLISQIQENFGIEVLLRSLFEAPTVAEFAELLMEQRLQNVGDDALSGMLDQLDGLSADDIELLLASDGVAS